MGDPVALLAPLIAGGLPVAMGLDLPLGVPRAFAEGRPEAGFPEFLRGLATRPGFFAVNEALETVCPDRPFYPQRGVKGMTRLAHARALGFSEASGLNRLCDLATAERPAGAPVFWTLGANQSGKAAIAAWRDWLAPALAAGAPYRLWPFEGPLASLLAPGQVALAEVYPAEALRHLSLRIPGSKRAHAARQALAPALLARMAELGAMPDAALHAMILAGFGTDAAGEDRLDCLLGVLDMILVLDGHRADIVPPDPWLRRWEGWVLGQHSLPRSMTGA
ncbi:hypothetical protein [Rhodovarius crocodyli]|uniref:hypothetical protein n=1 Tax=Rhodovarius crocodyli TaxID=1979269 RepID=UPI001F0C211A|nr:hypothetical protein [Rhodovarius crocodyli]